MALRLFSVSVQTLQPAGQPTRAGAGGEVPGSPSLRTPEPQTRRAASPAHSVSSIPPRCSAGLRHPREEEPAPGHGGAELRPPREPPPPRQPAAYPGPPRNGRRAAVGTPSPAPGGGFSPCPAALPASPGDPSEPAARLPALTEARRESCRRLQTPSRSTGGCSFFGGAEERERRGGGREEGKEEGRD